MDSDVYLFIAGNILITFAVAMFVTFDATFALTFVVLFINKLFLRHFYRIGSAFRRLHANVPS